MTKKRKKEERRGKPVFAISQVDDLLKDGYVQDCPFSINERPCGNWCPFFEKLMEPTRGLIIIFNCNESISGTFQVDISESETPKIGKEAEEPKQ